MIPAAAVEAAALAWVGCHAKPGSWTLEENLRAALEAAAPHMLADVTSDRKLLRTYFRSLTPDGELWCESRDPDEVLEMSEGEDCTFETTNFYETTGGWEEWKP